MDIDHTRRMLVNKTRRLHLLKEKQALQGFSTPAETLLEIEDMEIEISQLEAKLTDLSEQSDLIEVKPQVFGLPVGVWASPTLTLTNITANILHHVELTLQSGWPITLKQNRIAIENLKRGVSRQVNFEIKINEESGDDVFLLQLRLRADTFPSRVIPLQIFTVATSEPKAVNTIEDNNVPSIKDFRKELRKLTDTQIRELCYEDDFQDLTDDIVDPLISPARRTDRIIEFCRHRQKFGRLHQTLREILGPEYRFF